MSTTSAPPAQLVPWRRTLVGLAAFTSFAATAGAIQLVLGIYTPPVKDLEPLGLNSWILPGLWLALSVAVPCAVASWLAWRRDRRVGVAAICAALLLLLELAVQIPFVGLDPLQAVMGVVAVGLLVLGTLSRRTTTGQECGGPTPPSRGNVAS